MSIPLVIMSGKGQSQQWVLSEPLTENNDIPAIVLNPETRYQTILGFGGAFTEAAAYTLNRMSPNQQNRILQHCFDPREGLAYTHGRIAIHSCDFSLGNYTYLEGEDPELKSFDISHEEQWVLPMIRRAEEIRGQKLSLMASPWSPPGWMKTNGQMNHGGKLLPQYRDSWAEYIGKFIQSMQQKGFSMWALTVQNEPAATQVWDSCTFSPEEERDFIRDHLGPVLHRMGLEDQKLLFCDHNRDIALERAKAVYEDPEAARYVWGLGIHWYVSEDFSQLAEVHNRYPEGHIFFTEGCQEGGVHLGSWETGERYARNMIGDFNHWCEGYLDWNLLLDETGGPNHAGNFCDAPIIADTRSDQVHLNNSYYAIGHFSRYIQPGAQRIQWKGPSSCLCSAFRNPDRSVVAVLLNQSEEKMPLSIELEEQRVCLEMEKHSIATVIWNSCG